MQNLKIIGVSIFLQRRKTRFHVGTLNRVKGNLVFTYDERYFVAKNVFPLGPEFPLTQRKFASKKLFPSFEDRIPSRQNPAYPEYCQMTGIDPSESDPLVLLSTIGQKGPSSFIFYPIFERQITVAEAIQFRHLLGLTTREFAQVFELSQSALNALERNRSLGKALLKRLEIVVKFPSVALYFLMVNGGALMHDKLVTATNVLRSRERGEKK
jgi:HipA-like protein